jgi:arsenite methyltransferase
MTKHMGGREATDMLAQSCQINETSHVLDIGCGVGLTACYLPERYGCRLTGVDLSEQMVERSKERAVKKKVDALTTFQTANAEALPFEDGAFDAVICESVVAFSQKKQTVINEFTRVTKPGGYAGINEVTWVKTPPQSLKDYLAKAMGQVEFLTEEGWTTLFEQAGLENIDARVFKTRALRQWSGEARQIDAADLAGAWRSFFVQFARDPEVRRWVFSIMFPPLSAFNLFRYFGYGIYLGKKS